MPVGNIDNHDQTNHRNLPNVTAMLTIDIQPETTDSRRKIQRIGTYKSQGSMSVVLRLPDCISFWGTPYLSSGRPPQMYFDVEASLTGQDCCPFGARVRACPCSTSLRHDVLPRSVVITLAGIACFDKRLITPPAGKAWTFTISIALSIASLRTATGTTTSPDHPVSVRSSQYGFRWRRQTCPVCLPFFVTTYCLVR